MFQASVAGLFVDQHTGEPVVVIQGDDGRRIPPIWIGANAMLSMAVQLTGGTPPDPSRTI